MKEGLELLYALQQHDDQIIELQGLIKEIPASIKKMEDERDGKASIIESTKAKLNANIKDREKLEKEILQLREKIHKYKDQLNKATTNKEYQGFLAEIKFEENAISGVEEKIIEKMLESDEIMTEIRCNESEFAQIVTDYNGKIKDMTANLDYHRKKIEQLAAERSKMRGKIAANLLRIYDKIFTNKGGKAISFVETDFCGVCNVKIRPQRLNELILSDQMFTCESCGRVLYKSPIEAEEEELPGKRR